MTFFVVDAFRVDVVSCAEDSINDVTANLEEDGFGGSSFGLNGSLIHLVGAVGLILCIGASGDGWQCG
jgi:hypothetical protein